MKFVVIGLCLLTIVSCIHDPIHRRLIVKEDDESQEKKTWCIVQYSSGMGIYNSIIYIIHFFGPFLINLISMIILIKAKTRQYMIMHRNESYKTSFVKQFQEYKQVTFVVSTHLTLDCVRQEYFYSIVIAIGAI